MESLLTIGVANVLVAAALAGLAWTAGRLRRPALSHSLWVLVFLKLLAPPLLELRLPGPPRQAPAPPPPAAAPPVPLPPPAPLNVVVTVPPRVELAEARRVFVAEVLADPTGRPQILFTEPILPPEVAPAVPASPGRTGDVRRRVSRIASVSGPNPATDVA